jgi:hypothetical protein
MSDDSDLREERADLLKLVFNAVFGRLRASTETVTAALDRVFTINKQLGDER